MNSQKQSYNTQCKVDCRIGGNMQVTVIKKKEGRLDRNTGTIINGKLRACAYARVSTEEQVVKAIIKGADNTLKKVVNLIFE